jgi:hypothetical protein
MAKACVRIHFKRWMTIGCMTFQLLMEVIIGVAEWLKPTLTKGIAGS